MLASTRECVCGPTMMTVSYAMLSAGMLMVSVTPVRKMESGVLLEAASSMA